MKFFGDFVLVHVAIFAAVVKSDTHDEYRNKLPDNEDDYDDLDDQGGGGGSSLLIDNESLANRLLGVNGSTSRFSCISCDPPDCAEESVCHNALRCYTSHIRNTDGHEGKSKGEDNVVRMPSRNVAKHVLH